MKKYTVEYSTNYKDFFSVYDAKTKKSCEKQIELFWLKSKKSQIIKALKGEYDNFVYKYDFRCQIKFRIVEN